MRVRWKEKIVAQLIPTSYLYKVVSNASTLEGKDGGLIYSYRIAAQFVEPSSWCRSKDHEDRVHLSASSRYH